MGSSYSRTRPAVRTKWIQISSITQKSDPDVTQSTSFQRMPPGVWYYHPHNKQPLRGRLERRNPVAILWQLPRTMYTPAPSLVCNCPHCLRVKERRMIDGPRPQRIDLLYSFQTVTIVLFLDFLVFLAEIPALRPAGSDSVTAMLIVASSLASAGVAASKCSAAPSSITRQKEADRRRGTTVPSAPGWAAAVRAVTPPSPPGVEKRREAGWR